VKIDIITITNVILRKFKGVIKMHVLKGIIFALHGIISIGLIVSVLFQMSKHSELGGAFGSGALHTVFGREKGLDTLGKITLGLAIAFMVSSFLTAYALSI